MLMRRKLADTNIRNEEYCQNQLSLTVSLSGFNLLQQTLEPPEGRCVTADPEELNTTQRADIALALAVPDMLEN